MNHSVESDKFDAEQTIGPLPTIKTSSPSTNSDTDAMQLPEFPNSSNIANDACSENDEFDTSFVANNNHTVRRVSFLRSPTPASLNTTNASRGNVRRWSQSLTNAAKARQQKVKAITILPSQLQKHGHVLRTVQDEVDIEQFVHEIERHGYLMEDSALGEELRNATLRSLPQLLSTRMRIKTKLKEIVKEKSRQTGTNRWKRALHFAGFCSIKTKHFVRNTARNTKFWYDSMKEIEGHFGAGVETYFRFYRLLFVINIFLMIIPLVFIVFPQQMESFLNKTSPIASKVQPADTANDTSTILDVITVQGNFRSSAFFYGGYTNQEIQIFEKLAYSLPYAYFMTMILLYAGCFILFSITTAESYRKSFISASGGDSLRAHKLFCAWDFSISNEHAAKMKKDHVFDELNKSLNEFYEKTYCTRTFQQNLQDYSISIVVWLIIAVILFGVAYAIACLQIFDQNSGTELAHFLKISPVIVPSAVIVTMIVFQYVFAWLGSFEKYASPGSQLHISLIRNYLLEIVIMTSLIMFWLSQSEKEACWESTIGQRVFRLVVIEFLFVGCIGPALRAMRFIIYRFLWANIGLSEFNISSGSLGLILNQTLLWIGLFFAPVLAGAIVLKMIATFYIKKFVLIYFSKPPSKLWRSSQTYTLFLAMVFVSLTIVIVILLYVLTQINVSKECGPFNKHQLIFYVIRGDILKLQEKHALWQLITLLVRPAAIGGMLLTLCVLVYYMRTKTKSHIAMVKLLKDMIYIEGKDKEYLLANITRVTQENEWLMEDLIRQRFMSHRFNGTFDSSDSCSSVMYSPRDMSFLSNESNDFPKNRVIRKFSINRSSSQGLKKDIEKLRKRRQSSVE